VYIITDQERADFQKLTTAEQCDKFVEDFWERRNATPGSPENTFKQEHYRRSATRTSTLRATYPVGRRIAAEFISSAARRMSLNSIPAMP